MPKKKSKIGKVVTILIVLIAFLLVGYTFTKMVNDEPKPETEVVEDKGLFNKLKVEKKEKVEEEDEGTYSYIAEFYNCLDEFVILEERVKEIQLKLDEYETEKESDVSINDGKTKEIIPQDRYSDYYTACQKAKVLCDLL